MAGWDESYVLKVFDIQDALAFLTGGRIGKPVRFSCMMPGMFSSRSLFKRLLATLLPYCFAWGFVACVTLCDPHDTATRDAASSHLAAASLDDAHGGEHCPIREILTCALPERQPNAPAPRARGDVPALFAPSPGLMNGFALRLPAWQSNPPPTSDPPLERSGVLRL